MSGSVAKKIRSVCVFCGSSLGNDPQYAKEAEALGKELAKNGIKLVYGGGRAGLMGIVADSVLKNGGYAIGVLPNFMKTREIDHTGLSECHYVESMHERKQKMASLADAFVCLPGGYGTFEEMMEMITWVQLKLHSKPVLLFNVNGFYDGLIKFVDSAVDAGFIRPDLRQVTLLSTDKVEAVIPQLEEWDGSDIVDILALKKAVGSDEGAGNLNLT